MKSTRSFLKSRAFPIPGLIRVNRSDSKDAASENCAQTVAVCGGDLLPDLHLEQQAVAHSGNADSRGQQASTQAPHDANENEPTSVAMHISPDAAVGSEEDRTSEASISKQDVPPQERSRSSTHVAKFQKLLSDKVVDLEGLRKVAWSGIPPNLRPLTWRLLLGYLPPNKDRRDVVLQRKRREYMGMVPEFYGEGRERSEEESAMLRQVELDAPRTAPSEPFFHQELIQRSLVRILYLWGVRHPASGYVQGINDLVTPFMAVFFSEHFDSPMDTWDITGLEHTVLMDVEADCYWCLCKILDNIQDHYTYAQPGIQRKVFKIKELVRRINEPLALHLEEEGVEFMLFAHRWVNCLLVRELPLLPGVRLWDTFFAEHEEFGDFFVYTCVSFLNTWANKLLALEFQEIMMLLQKMPTSGWGEKEIETMLATAFLWRTSFGNAQSHLST